MTVILFGNRAAWRGAKSIHLCFTPHRPLIQKDTIHLTQASYIPGRSGPEGI